MPVIINEFEVVSAPPRRQEPPPRPAAGEAPAAEPQQRAALVRALIRHQERLARLRAH